MLINQFLILGAVLFCIGVYGVIARKNAVLVLMSIELILNAVNLNLLAFALRNNRPRRPRLRAVRAGGRGRRSRCRPRPGAAHLSQQAHDRARRTLRDEGLTTCSLPRPDGSWRTRISSRSSRASPSVLILFIGKTHADEGQRDRHRLDGSRRSCSRSARRTSGFNVSMRPAAPRVSTPRRWAGSCAPSVSPARSMARSSSR